MNRFSLYVIFLMASFSFSHLQAQIQSEKAAIQKPMEETEALPLAALAESPAQIIVHADSLFFELLDTYVAEKKVMGYRIQLFSGNKRSDADQVRAQFMKKYQDQRPDLVYLQPNFKIRVGNYKDRLIASKHLRLYKIDFPSAFLVKAPIQAPQY